MDISHQKRAEELQAERVKDVLETKRQSENFIDMVRQCSSMLSSAFVISLLCRLPVSIPRSCHPPLSGLLALRGSLIRELGVERTNVL
jgi:hypothetical protein